MSGRYGLYAFEQGIVRIDVLKGEILVQSLEAKLFLDLFILEDGFYLRSEDKSIAVEIIVERLYAIPIAGQEQALSMGVPEGKGNL